MGYLGGPWIAAYWGAANFELYLGFAIYLAFSTTWLQSTLPKEALGRFFASRGTLHAMARLLGVLLYGFLLQTFLPEVSVALLIVALVANAPRWDKRPLRPSRWIRGIPKKQLISVIPATVWGLLGAWSGQIRSV